MSLLQFQQASRYLREVEHIKSSTAIYNILRVVRTGEFTLNEVANRWQEEKSTVLQLIAAEARAKYPESKVHQNVQFAVNTLLYLQFGVKLWDPDQLRPTIPEVACPYTKGAFNFMYTLLKTNQCLCLCYTDYVLAAAQEYGFELIFPCPQPGHVNLAIAYPPSEWKPKRLRPQECSSSEYGSLCLEQKSLRIPKLHTLLDAGYADNTKMLVQTHLPSSEWFSLFVEGEMEIFDALVNITQVRGFLTCSPSGDRDDPDQIGNFSPSLCDLVRNPLGYENVTLWTVGSGKLLELLNLLVAVYGTPISPLIHLHRLVAEGKPLSDPRVQKVIGEFLVFMKAEAQRTQMFPSPTCLKEVLEITIKNAKLLQVPQISQRYSRLQSFRERRRNHLGSRRFQIRRTRDDVKSRAPRAPRAPRTPLPILSSRIPRVAPVASIASVAHPLSPLLQLSSSSSSSSDEILSQVPNSIT